MRRIEFFCVAAQTTGDEPSTWTEWIREDIAEGDDVFTGIIEEEPQDTIWECLLVLSFVVLVTIMLRVSSTLRGVA